MESVLVLTHVDESGSALTKASLEAVTAGQALAQRLAATLAIGIVAADAHHAAESVGGTGARYWPYRWSGICGCALCERCGGVRSAVPRCSAHFGAGSA